MLQRLRKHGREPGGLFLLLEEVRSGVILDTRIPQRLVSHLYEHRGFSSKILVVAGLLLRISKLSVKMRFTDMLDGRQVRASGILFRSCLRTVFLRIN